MFNIDVFLISVEIILRAEAVEQAQAGDKCDFTGTLIVVPDVAQLSTPGIVSIFNCLSNGGRFCLRQLST